jgi:IS1 family transposase
MHKNKRTKRNKKHFNNILKEKKTLKNNTCKKGMTDEYITFCKLIKDIKNVKNKKSKNLSNDQ